MQAPLMRWRWLGALLAGIFAWYLAAIVGLAGSQLAGGGQTLQGLPLAVYGTVRAAVALAGLALAVRVAGLRLRDLGLRADHWRSDVLIGLALGTALPALQFAVLLPLTGGAERTDVIASRALVGDGWLNMLAAVLVGWLVGGVAEEVFFRGHLITLGRRVLGDGRWAVAAVVALSSLYFGAVHAYQGWAGLVDTGLTGLLLAALYVWRGRLTASMVAHGLSNTLLILGLYLWY